MSAILLRPVALDELSRCAALVVAEPAFAAYQIDEARLVRILEGVVAEGRAELLGAELDGTLVGFAWFVPRGAFDRSGYLRLIAVEGAAQGRGVGRGLVAELEARHLHPCGIVLLCAVGNVAAAGFYARLGYLEAGRLPSYVGPGLDERIFFKPG